MQKRRTRGLIAAAAIAAMLLAACASDDDSASDDGGSSGTEAPDATGPAPGVTDDTIKVGVTYVDVESLKASGLNFNLGDHEAVYNALFDDINANGGINGRKIEPVFAPINPTSPTPAEEACVKLTEDEDVFVITGFFLNDAVVCPVSTHETAVVGGGMSPDRLEQAAAPWLTWLPDTSGAAEAVTTLDEKGELDGKVAVFSNARDKETLDTYVTPTLDDLGVDVVETGVATTAATDPTALQAEVQTIGEKFESSGADTVILVGASGQDWPTAMSSNTSYRPKLIFLDPTAIKSFASNAATTDTSILEGALAVGPYGPDQARFEEATMQACVQILTDAGLETPEPKDVGDDPSNRPFEAAFQACPDVVLLKAWLEAAGDNLNYGTLEQAADGLKVTIPTDPTERTYAIGESGDGDPAAYIFEWDETAQDVVLVED